MHCLAPPRPPPLAQLPLPISAPSTAPARTARSYWPFANPSRSHAAPRYAVPRPPYIQPLATLHAAPRHPTCSPSPHYIQPLAHPSRSPSSRPHLTTDTPFVPPPQNQPNSPSLRPTPPPRSDRIGRAGRDAAAGTPRQMPTRNAAGLGDGGAGLGQGRADGGGGGGGGWVEAGGERVAPPRATAPIFRRRGTVWAEYHQRRACCSYVGWAPPPPRPPRAHLALVRLCQRAVRPLRRVGASQGPSRGLQAGRPGWQAATGHRRRS